MCISVIKIYKLYVYFVAYFSHKKIEFVWFWLIDGNYELIPSDVGNGGYAAASLTMINTPFRYNRNSNKALKSPTPEINRQGFLALSSVTKSKQKSIFLFIRFVYDINIQESSNTCHVKFSIFLQKKLTIAPHQPFLHQPWPIITIPGDSWSKEFSWKTIEKGVICNPVTRLRETRETNTRGRGASVLFTNLIPCRVYRPEIDFAEFASRRQQSRRAGPFAKDVT